LFPTHDTKIHIFYIFLLQIIRGVRKKVRIRDLENLNYIRKIQKRLKNTLELRAEVFEC